jgi:RNA polymerase sigma factor (sigma-70 family)
MSIQEFNQTVVAQQHIIGNYAIKLTSDREMAKDLCQETFYRAFVYREKFQPGTNIKAWLCTIMHNIFVSDCLRRQTKNRILNNFIPSVEELKTRNSQDMVVKEVQSAIHALPVSYQRLFQLHLAGYKYKEIAQHTGMHLSTVKSRLRMARLQLQKKLCLK